MTTPRKLEAGLIEAASAKQPQVTLRQKKSVFKTIFGRKLKDTDEKLSYELMFQKIDEHASYKKDGPLTDAVIKANIKCINSCIAHLRLFLNTAWSEAIFDLEPHDRFVAFLGYPDLTKVLEVAFDIWIHVKQGLRSILGNDLSASDLETFYPVRVVRTLYVNNHLRYNRDPPDKGKPTLEVFIDWSALAFLEADNPTSTCYGPNHPIPDGLSADVSDVLSLMFNESRGTRRLIRSKIDNEKAEDAKRAWRLVQEARASERPQFQFFTDRLRYVHTLYHTSPDGWWQPLFDRRNREKHLTLVIAVLAFVFADLSTATGAISAGYAIMQYNLGVDAACAGAAGSARLAKYCN